MDETKLSFRKKRILSALREGPLSRKEITNALKDSYPVSKATLIRDLNELIKGNFIKKKGEGRRVKYLLTQKNPLLAYIDINDYFADDSRERRNIKTGFNFQIFKNLKNIIEPKEAKELKKVAKNLSQQEKKLDPTIFRREIERFTVEFSWKSSKIEGNTYSLLETEILIKQMKEAAGHPKYEATMILNHKDAIDFILKNKERFVKISLDELFNLHSILSKDLEITPGIRKHSVAISGTSYLPLVNKKEIELALKNLTKIINKTVSPLEKALIAACMAAYMQAFADGNKRTARTLANAILLAHDFYPISYRSVEELEYMQALIIFYEKNNLYHFKRIFLEQFKFAVENYFRV